MADKFQDPESLTEHLLDLFQFSPTPHQYRAFHQFAFYYLAQRHKCAFILKGSAGTGKTTLLSTLVKFFLSQKRPVITLAPTGRAAKVISRKTKRSAWTLHRHIYTALESPTGVKFVLAENEDNQGTVYLVDEASMIGDGEGGQPRVLEDIFSFIWSRDPSSILVLSGDDAQLPPVGSGISPALDETYLKKQLGVHVFMAQLSEVKRQALTSGIYLNASKLRRVLKNNLPSLRIHPNPQDLIQVETRWEALEIFNSRFDPTQPDQMVVVTFSNAMALQFNQAYRAQAFEGEANPRPGDRIMIVKNNYQIQAEGITFLANGETGYIRKIYPETMESKYGLDWMDIELELENRKGELIEIKVKIILDLLRIATPSLPYDKIRYVMECRKKEPRKAGEKDPYLAALQVKYAYAITGHKAQGGQWEEVMVIFEPLYPNVTLQDYFRWAYTAITRAERKVYLVDCPFLGDELPEICYRDDFQWLPEKIEDNSIYSSEEKEHLLQHGKNLIALLNGLIPANTTARQQLIQVINKEKEPTEIQEIALLKYIEQLDSTSKK